MVRTKLLFILLVISVCTNVIFVYRMYTGEKGVSIKDELPSGDGTSYLDPAGNRNRVIAFTGKEDPIFLRGEVKKEIIPEELELGDFWYWLYFEEPYLLLDNASGVPMYIDKIQLVPPENKDFYDLENFVNKRVEIHGYQGWGYAESSVFQVMAVREY